MLMTPAASSQSGLETTVQIIEKEFAKKLLGTEVLGTSGLPKRSRTPL